MILSAARVLLPRGVWLEPGAIHVSRGRIAAIARPNELRHVAPTALRVELPGCALLPGLVNAHAHLELTGLAGTTSRGRDFGGWVREVVQLRAQQDCGQLERATLLGARQSLASGATTVGDFDATGAAERALRESSTAVLPRVVLFRELLDARNPERTMREVARIAEPAPGTELLQPGLAPHAPHTVSESLLRAIGRAATTRGLPLATHWAETEEETSWLESGSGPFAPLLGLSPQRSGLDLLEAAGLLRPGLALVHGNCARADEIERVARSGASLVHCPGTHAFFERAPFDLRAWHAAGVAVALGTDSLASNSALDMRLELSRLFTSHPWLDARDAWDAATVHGARALGLQGQVGELQPGSHADLLAVRAPETDGQRCFERMAHGDFDVLQVWIGGRSVPAADTTVDTRNASAGCAPGEGNPG